MAPRGNNLHLLGAALHLHSHFSLLRGTDSPADLCDWAARAGYRAVALNDVNGLYGAIPFYHAARAAGLKPILGVELRLDEPTGRRGGDDAVSFAVLPRSFRAVRGAGPGVGEPPARLTLIARSPEGYRNICRLTSLLQLEPQRFELLDDLARHGEGLFVLCDRADWLAPLAGRLPGGSLFAELAPGQGAAGRTRLRKLYAAAVKARVPVAASLDSYFVGSADLAGDPEAAGPGGEDAGDDTSGWTLHRVVTDIRLGTAGRSPRPEDYQSPDRYHRPPGEMAAFFGRCPEGIANANRIAEQCDDEVVQLGRFHFPVSRTPHGETGFSYLHKLCDRGLRRRYRPVRPDVVARLSHELNVIEKLRFADYFLFVHEIVGFARRKGIPVDVRGSSAGSLVAYALGFTQVCPIEHDLYFERFLHEGRTDCPDIDIDLCWRRRDEVIDFCYRRWGRERVAMICTHNAMRARGAFNEVAKVMGLSADQAHQLSRHIPEGIAAYLDRDWRDLVEARRNLPLDDPRLRRILRLAGRLEGAPRHLGIHCGGLVISPRPLTDYLPLQWASKGIVVTQYEMNAVEAVGLVKMDLLGNRALSEVAESRRLLSTPGPLSAEPSDPPAIDLDRLPPHDERTARLLSAADTLGVFQAESPGMRRLCRQLRVSSQEELTVALSVIRPGPAAIGMKASYVARHTGQEPVNYLHPKLATLLRRTHGVMLYQEDTMRVAVGLAGFSPGEADMLRKAVSKRRSPERMAELRDTFLRRATRHTPDLDPALARTLWEQIEQFARYSFCRAHACVYGRIAWQTAWLKAHHPAAFYTGLFNNHMGMYPMRVHVSDAVRHGLRVLPPHVNDSQAEAGPLDATTIRLGLRFVRELSASGVDRIVAGRRSGPYANLDALRRSARLAEPELVNLIRCGACDGLGENRRAMLAEVALETPVGELLIGAQSGGGNGDGPPAGRFPWARPFSPIETLQAEIDVLGMFLSDHPMSLVRGDWVEAARLGEHLGRRVAVAGVLDATRTTKTKNGELMRFVTLEDATGLVECTLFPRDYERLGHLFYHLGPFRIEGVVDDDDGAISVTADTAEPLLHDVHEPLKRLPPAGEEPWPDSTLAAEM